MTDYKAIIGKGVKVVSTNLDNAEGEGQIWFNSTTGEFKDIINVTAWASGGNITQATTGVANAGTQTASVAYGGNDGSATTRTLEYNGSGWTAGGALPEARSEMSKGGTQTAAIATGGKSSPPGMDASFEYDGSSWTAGGTMGTGRYTQGGDGTQTAAFICGGQLNPPISPSNATEEYNGSSWTAGGNLNQARNRIRAAGLQTSGLALGGSGYPLSVGPIGTSSEEYDGSSWTTGNAINTARYGHAAGGAQTSALLFGGTGSPTTLTATESYDGTSYTTSPASLASGRNNLGGDGGNNAYLAVGGNVSGPAKTSNTEEFTSSVNLITAPAWASGGNMPVAKRIGACSKGGSVDSSLTFGGDTLPMGAGQPQVKTTEEYDGSSWTSGGNIANNISGSAGAGTQTAAIGATGYSFPSPWQTAGASYVSNSFEYDGSSWTNVTAYPTTAVGLISFGTQTASAFGGGAQGGSPGPEASYKSKDYKEYDGTNWTSGGSTNSYHSRTQSSAGTQTAGIVYGGYDSPGGNPSQRGDTVEEYNGTAWTSALTAPKENAIGAGFGTQSAFLATNGQEGPIPSSPGSTGYSLTTFVYDGTTFATDANVATRRVYAGGDGTIGSAAGMVCGGSTTYSTRTTATEEYTQGSTALNIKTVSTS